ncbi:diguanylate cyclase domain-containing protein [Thalassobacillus sp. CUG 92003]|uniref:diguanylate cyclase domain-containing protein n=1 Tax=Thalassobacillus sp. CUG 92003 TaxID=2736641 RepID=UPI0015E6CDC7|nr:diguanylate cyclase [Thalassobacillus sp. CUG 92003]
MDRQLYELLTHDGTMVQQFSDSISDGVLLIQCERDEYWYRYINHEARRYFGETEVVGRWIQDVHSHDTSRIIKSILHEAEESGENVYKKKLHNDLSGFMGDMMIQPVRDEDGRSTCYLVVAKNFKAYVKDMELAEKKQALVESEERYQALIDMSPDAVFVHDDEDRIIYVNAAGVAMLHAQTQHDIMDERIYRFIDESVAHIVHQELRKILEHGNKSGPIERKFRRIDGTPFDVEIHAARVSYNGHYAVQSICRDITERKVYQDQLEQMAYRDQLTNLPNRRYFMKRLQDEITEAEQNEKQQLAVLYVDLDNFKDINDTYGHHVGDEVLILFSKRLRSVLRTSDVLARIGGDEFLILLPDIASEEDVAIVTDRIMNHVEQPMVMDGATLNITASIGASIYPAHGTDDQRLLSLADTAMYQAKRIGKQRMALYQASDS